jgi:hypothetical protein
MLTMLLTLPSVQLLQLTTVEKILELEADRIG